MEQYNPPNPARAKLAKPPVLHQGVHHQTPAVKTLHALAHAAGTGVRRRKKKAGGAAHARKARTPRKAKTHHKRKARTSKAHLVAGSPAARKRMAQLRAMRGKKAAAGG